MNRVREKWMAFPLKLRVIAPVGFLVTFTGVALLFIDLAVWRGGPDLTESIGLVIVGIGLVLVGFAYRFAPTGSSARMTAWPCVLFGAAEISHGLEKSCSSWVGLHTNANARAQMVRGLELDFLGSRVIFMLVGLGLLVVAIAKWSASHRPGLGNH